MHCEHGKLPDGGYFICCRSGRRPMCSVPGCNGPGQFQCDFPLAGKKRGKTCSKYLCRVHRVQQPIVVGLQTEALDYCPAHDAIAKGKTP